METKIIGGKIAEARKKLNISQAQLAEQLFISAQAVGKWERGESLPDIITLNRLAEIFNVDLNYFSGKEQSAKAEMSLDPGSENASSQMPGWDMSRGNWVAADFSGLKNLHEKFSSSNMKECKFIGSEMSGLLLKNNNVDSSDFSGSDIGNSHIQSSNLTNNVFKDAFLKKTDFSESNIYRCDFSGASFIGAEFSKSYIYGCNLSGADLTGVIIKSGGLSGERSKEVKTNTITNAVWSRTSFIDTQIADLILTGTLEDCYFENCKFTRVIFQNATLVNTFFKNN